MKVVNKEGFVFETIHRARVAEWLTPGKTFSPYLLAVEREFRPLSKIPICLKQAIKDEFFRIGDDEGKDYRIMPNGEDSFNLILHSNFENHKYVRVNPKLVEE